MSKKMKESYVHPFQEISAQYATGPVSPGLTKREYIAIEAMKVFLQKNLSTYQKISYKQLAEDSYAMADIMIRVGNE